MRINGEEIPARPMSDGHIRTQLDCGTFFLTLHEYDAGWHDELHTHPHGQFGHVLEGEMVLRIDGEEIEQLEGESIFVSGNVEHSSSAPVKTVTLNLYVKPEAE
jgi:quercetin dioxygenase-like cupin family protein